MLRGALRLIVGPVAKVGPVVGNAPSKGWTGPRETHTNIRIFHAQENFLGLVVILPAPHVIDAKK